MKGHEEGATALLASRRSDLRALRREARSGAAPTANAEYAENAENAETSTAGWHRRPVEQRTLKTLTGAEDAERATTRAVSQRQPRWASRRTDPCAAMPIKVVAVAVELSAFSAFSASSAFAVGPADEAGPASAFAVGRADESGPASAFAVGAADEPAPSGPSVSRRWMWGSTRPTALDLGRTMPGPRMALHTAKP
jgi:hypothetical protein